MKNCIDEYTNISAGFDGIFFVCVQVQVGYSKVERASTWIVLRLQELDMLKSCVKELLEMKPELRLL